MSRISLLALLAFIATAHAQEQFIVLNQDYDVSPNHVSVPLMRGDCFRFVKQDNSQVFFQVGNLGVFQINWDRVTKYLWSEELAKKSSESEALAQNEYSVGIPSVTKGRQSPEEVKSAEDAMSRIETYGLYAVGKVTESIATTIADGSSEWYLARGETFPFLGFRDGMAYVRIGASYMPIHSESVDIVPLNKHPDLASRYAAIVAQFRADMEAEKRQASLDEINQRLRDVEAGQAFILQQQQYQDWLLRNHPNGQ